MKQTQRREFTMSKHETAVNWTDSSGSSSKASITPKTWLVYCRISIDSIWKSKICRSHFLTVRKKENEKHIHQCKSRFLKYNALNPTICHCVCIKYLVWNSACKMHLPIPNKPNSSLKVLFLSIHNSLHHKK